MALSFETLVHSHISIQPSACISPSVHLWSFKLSRPVRLCRSKGWFTQIFRYNHLHKYLQSYIYGHIQTYRPKQYPPLDTSLQSIRSEAYAVLMLTLSICRTFPIAFPSNFNPFLRTGSATIWLSTLFVALWSPSHVLVIDIDEAVIFVGRRSSSNFYASSYTSTFSSIFSATKYSTAVERSSSPITVMLRVTAFRIS